MIDLYGREVIPRVRELLAATPEPNTSLAAGAGADDGRRCGPPTSPQTAPRPPPGKSMIGVSASSAPASSAPRSPAPPSRPATTSPSRDQARADNIALTIDVLAPGAHAATTDEVVGHADVIVLAVPTHRFRELQPDLFAGKVLVDATNYWPPVDGDDPELADAPEGTSTIVQQHFPAARLVKSLNQLGYHQLEENQRPHGAPEPDRNRRSRRRPTRRPHGHATPRPSRLRPSRRRPAQERRRPRARRLTDRDHLQRRTAGQAHLALMAESAIAERSSVYGARRAQPVAAGGKWETSEYRSNKPIRNRWQPTATVSERMVRGPVGEEGDCDHLYDRAFMNGCSYFS